MTGRLIVTGQVVVDLVVRIPAVPAPGEDVFASQYGMFVGGDFIVMAAAARDGARVVYTGGLGGGRFGELALTALTAEGIGRTATPVDVDTGFSVAMVDDRAERTFVSVRGAECLARPDDLRAAGVTGDDIVLVSGYSLLDRAKATVLLGGLAGLPDRTRVAFDPGPLLADIPANFLAEVLARTDVWTGNAREAAGLTPGTGGAPEEVIARQLRAGAVVVIRRGADGCTVFQAGSVSRGDGAAPGAGAIGPRQIDGFAVRAVDSNGAGDTHTGVLLGALLTGLDPVAAARRANAAAALAVTGLGPATAPQRAEIDELLRRD